jgi:hypothetical protein
MPTHVIINFAEGAKAAAGVTSKVKDMLEEQAGYSTKRHGMLWLKTTTTCNATIHKYDLVDGFNETGGGNFGFDQQLINDIQMKVSQADSIYYCAHGSAADADEVYTQIDNKVTRLTTVTRFAAFAKLILSKDKVHDFRLIVCFAARSTNPDSNHTRTFLSSGADNYRTLKSSLAYKFFKDLTQSGYPTKLYARLGEVRVDLNSDHGMDILTQSEEAVIAGIGLSLNSATEQRLGALVNPLRQYEIRQKVAVGSELGVLNDAETSWLTAYQESLRLNNEKKRQAVATSTGRLRYEKITGGNLQIKFEGTEIYNGAFL